MARPFTLPKFYLIHFDRSRFLYAHTYTNVDNGDTPGWLTEKQQHSFSPPLQKVLHKSEIDYP